MGYEELVRALEDETVEKTTKLLEEAKAQAHGLTENAQADAEKLRQHKLNEIACKLTVENTSKKNIFSASLTGDLSRLKNSLMEQVFREALDKIRDTAPEKYSKAVESLCRRLQNHVEVYPDGTIYGNPDDIKTLKKGGKIEPSAEIQGFVFKSNDEKVIAESSFETVLEAIKPALINELKELLFHDI